MDTILKKIQLLISYFQLASGAFGRWALFLALTLVFVAGCRDKGPQLPDPDTLFPTPEPEVIVIDGDTIPMGYSKTIDDLTRMTSLTDDVDLLTIHGTSGSKVWKKFYASVLQAYVMDSLSTIGDVTITSPSSDQVLKWNGSAWVNGTVAGSGDVTTAQLADSTSALRTDLALSVSGSYDYLTVSGQDIVRGQVDLSTDVTGSANSVTVTNPVTGTNTILAALDSLYDKIVQNTLLIQDVTPATSTTITVNQNSRTNCISIIDMTTASAVSTITLSMSNSAAGVITLSFENTTSGMEIDFPSTFLDQTGATWDGASTYSVTEDFFMTCYSSDGTNWKCK